MCTSSWQLQFRHLTFQEYLAAVAAVDGYTLTADRSKLPLSALKDHLTSDEWKEVIPMAAVLGRRQAEPLLEALTHAAEVEKDSFLQDETAHRAKRIADQRMRPATSRLAQAMVEEADFAPETLQNAAHLVAFFAEGCRTSENWQALSRGPYGPDLRTAAFQIYVREAFSQRVLARNTTALLEALSEPDGFWTAEGCEGIILDRLQQSTGDELTQCMLGISGCFWLYRVGTPLVRSEAVYDVLERSLFDKHPPRAIAAIWAWSFWRYLQKDTKRKAPIPTNATLVSLVRVLLEQPAEVADVARFAIGTLVGVNRAQCKMPAGAQDLASLRAQITEGVNNQTHLIAPLLRITYIVEGLFTDAELRGLLRKVRLSPLAEAECRDMFEALSVPITARRGPRPQKP